MCPCARLTQAPHPAPGLPSHSVHTAKNMPKSPSQPRRAKQLCLGKRPVNTEPETGGSAWGLQACGAAVRPLACGIVPSHIRITIPVKSAEVRGAGQTSSVAEINEPLSLPISLKLLQPLHTEAQDTSSRNTRSGLALRSCAPRRPSPRPCRTPGLLQLTKEPPVPRTLLRGAGWQQLSGTQGGTPRPAGSRPLYPGPARPPLLRRSPSLAGCPFLRPSELERHFSMVTAAAPSGYSCGTLSTDPLIENQFPGNLLTLSSRNCPTCVSFINLRISR